ncbi:hypothetical protein QF028_003492 [Neobacillus sp. B4I6]|uniref:hypothetical protein n=1 Tax=Bacillaceae TaxID=186817 RepID=UPI001BE609AF|nr:MULTISPECIES: hypothetical protein [unclassified Bacillus (in: firmicutes)]MBT2700368.1 hypothetical protein [Bacillus sp. ISL-40]MBT2722347.1 hypothetical protein [Bacillus sp. ISL-46]MBT2742401.1 hypothetical protein [Bacillus sp. ISL-77]
MYKLQICNALTQEILREKTYKKPDLILSLIESGTKGQECFLFDEQRKTLKGTYVTHSSFNEGDTKVYKVLFKVKLSEIQARIAK